MSSRLLRLLFFSSGHPAGIDFYPGRRSFQSCGKRIYLTMPLIERQHSSWLPISSSLVDLFTCRRWAAPAPSASDQRRDLCFCPNYYHLTSSEPPPPPPLSFERDCGVDAVIPLPLSPRPRWKDLLPYHLCFIYPNNWWFVHVSARLLIRRQRSSRISVTKQRLPPTEYNKKHLQGSSSFTIALLSEIEKGFAMEKSNYLLLVPLSLSQSSPVLDCGSLWFDDQSD